MKNLLLTLLVISTTGLYAFGQSITPQVINTTGGTYSHDYYNLDWSIGELALVNQMQSSDFIVSNGFLQPFIQYHDLINNDIVFGDGEILILPNPTHDILEIDFRSRQIGEVVLRLYDALGRVLVTNSFYSYGFGQIEKINLTAAKIGTYFLRIELKPEQGFVHKTGTYKIIKR